MLQELLFYESVHTAAIGLRAVEEVCATDDVHCVELIVTDVLPAEEPDPWQLRVQQREDFGHPLFGQRYPCIEMSLPLWTIQPTMPGYLELVATSAAPCLDHQRFCIGASVIWDPETGQMAVTSHVRLWPDQAQTTLITQLHECIRDVVALTYLTSFRMWQLQFRRQMPEDITDPIIERVHDQMLGLLDAEPPRL